MPHVGGGVGVDTRLSQKQFGGEVRGREVQLAEPPVVGHHGAGSNGPPVTIYVGIARGGERQQPVRQVHRLQGVGEGGGEAHHVQARGSVVKLAAGLAVGVDLGLAAVL